MVALGVVFLVSWVGALAGSMSMAEAQRALYALVRYHDTRYHDTTEPRRKRGNFRKAFRVGRRQVFFFDETVTPAQKRYEEASETTSRRLYVGLLKRLKKLTAGYFVLVTLSQVLYFVASLSVVRVALLLKKAFESEKRQKLEAIKAQKRVIHDMMVPAMLVDNKSFVLKDANAAALATFGISEKELFGKNFDVERVIPNYRSNFCDETKESPASSPRSKQRQLQGIQRMHVQGVNVRDGSHMQLLVHLRRVKDEHSLIMQDISDELEIQEKILAQFTHEMRNKYVAAIAMLEQIQVLSGDENKSSDSEIRRELKQLHEDIKVSAALLHEGDQLVTTRLSLHKVYNGSYKTEPNVQTFELNDFMSMKVAGAAALAQKAVQFLVDIPVKLQNNAFELFVRTDTYMLGHISSNLLSNARKFTYAGSVSFSFLGAKDDFLVFSVKDTGAGMRPHIAQRLFKEEVHNGDDRGVGLGLVSCRKFAECIGGSIWLQDTKARTTSRRGGSEFRFKLPGKVLTSTSNQSSPVAPQTSSKKQILAFSSATPSRRSNIAHNPNNLKDDTYNHASVPYPSLTMNFLKRPTQKFSAQIAPRQTSPVPAGKKNIIPSALATIRKLYIVEDSDMIRRTIIMKLKAARHRACGDAEPWDISEFETVESLLGASDDLTNILHRTDLIITVDENLDS